MKQQEIKKALIEHMKEVAWMNDSPEEGNISLEKMAEIVSSHIERVNSMESREAVHQYADSQAAYSRAGWTHVDCGNLGVGIRYLFDILWMEKTGKDIYDS